MNTDFLFLNLQKLIPLTEVQKHFLTGILRERKIKKGQLLVQGRNRATLFFFYCKGFIELYYIATDGKEHIVQFASEGWWISDLNSFTRQVRQPLMCRHWKIVLYLNSLQQYRSNV